LPASGWAPREYQLPFWSYLEAGGTRAMEIAHRRWGKDEIALHWSAIAAHQRQANYWHMLPEYAQGRKAIWEATNPHTGRRRIDEAFPKELRAATNAGDMFIRFKNGSSWQVIGSDNYHSLVGTAPAGVVFSEWSRANPAAWAYINPILNENGGWAAFITTPIGNNHAKKMLDGRARIAPGSPRCRRSTTRRQFRAR
jgi:phage terminase large subunit